MPSAPLKGKRILLTRAAEQLPALADAVRQRGGIPVSLPCLKVRMLVDDVQQALARIDEFSDVAFTSRNGVLSVRQAADDLPRVLEGRRIAAVGGATATALGEAGVQADIVPADHSQDGLVEAYQEAGLPHSLLFFRASEGREFLARALQSEGVRVETVAAYDTVCPDDDATDVIRQLQDGHIDAVLLGSPKVANFYVQRIGNTLLADRPAVAAISEQVSMAAMDAGLSVQVVSKRASFVDMLDGVASYFRDQQPA
ncbi:MAG: uroporphyrinogen-III synthase [Mariprofundaceae bacterium]